MTTLEDFRNHGVIILGDPTKNESVRFFIVTVPTGGARARWDTFTRRAIELQENAPQAHVELVKNALKYGRTHLNDRNDPDVETCWDCVEALVCDPVFATAKDGLGEAWHAALPASFSRHSFESVSVFKTYCKQ
jgi:hypothetical protein